MLVVTNSNLASNKRSTNGLAICYMAIVTNKFSASNKISINKLTIDCRTLVPNTMRHQLKDQKTNLQEITGQILKIICVMKK